jgi:acetylglutamate kinase/N-acetylglutamate synthase-like GNAT family acetyltransferase
VKDLALLAKTGFKVIIVPGAKEKIDEVLKGHGIVSSSILIDGSPVRITTSQALPFVEMAAFDVASRFMTFLSGSRVEAVIGNFVRARGMGVKKGVDTEHTGAVDKVYADSLGRVLNLGMIPILPCIGWSPSGRPYNVSSDEIALAVSTALGAVKLFIISIYEGLLTDYYQLIETDFSTSYRDFSTRNRDFSTSDKDLSPRNGDLSPNHGDLSPSNGDLSPRNWDLSPNHGDLSPSNGDLSPRNWDLSPLLQLEPGTGLQPEPGTSRSAPSHGDTLPSNGDTLRQKVKIRPDGRLASLTTGEAEAFLAANGGISGKSEGESKAEGEAGAPSLRQYLRELKLALRASKAGVHRAHIIDGREEGAVLKELFSNLGVGTMIYADEYDSIRAFHSKDMPEVLRLMEPLMRQGILVRRNAEQIQEKKDDYAVFEIDGAIRACGALHDWGESQGEIAGVATDPLYTDMGLGRRIVGYLIEKARNSRMRRVFALTTQTQDWFETLGFKEAPVETLPEQKRKAYDKSRNSKVFALDL